MKGAISKRYPKVPKGFPEWMNVHKYCFVPVIVDDDRNLAIYAQYISTRLTQDDLARMYGITRQRVEQLVFAIAKRIRQYKRSQGRANANRI